MQRKSLDVWVGLFVLLGAAALMFLALKAGNMSAISFEKTYQVVSLRFDNVGGLKPRAPVKSAGVVVGRVGEIRFDDKGFQALVILNLEGALQVSRGQQQKILTSGLLGEQYIGLEAGGDSETLVSGDKLNMTQSAIVLENLISQFLFNKAAEGRYQMKSRAMLGRIAIALVAVSIISRLRIDK